MERRNCCTVITEMLTKVPTDKTDLIEDLNWNHEDASYKALEENLQWYRTMKTLQKHIPMPTHDWEFEVLSIFTTRPINELKQMVTENDNFKS